MAGCRLPSCTSLVWEAGRPQKSWVSRVRAASATLRVTSALTQRIQELTVFNSTTIRARNALGESDTSPHQFSDRDGVWFTGYMCVRALCLLHVRAFAPLAGGTLISLRFSIHGLKKRNPSLCVWFSRVSERFETPWTYLSFSISTIDKWKYRSNGSFFTIVNKDLGLRYYLRISITPTFIFIKSNEIFNFIYGSHTQLFSS